MIGLLLIGCWPYKVLANYHKGIQITTNLEGTQKCLYYTLIVLVIRLFRFGLRFTCVFILMIIAVYSWLCRKRVTKGRKEQPEEQK
jgi:hypothetical protein